MSEEIEKLIKIQGKINKNRYHLHVNTDLQKNYYWVLYIKFNDNRDYFSSNNQPIMNSEIDSLDDLYNYLSRHHGFDRW